MHPSRDQRCLAGDDAVEQRAIGRVAARDIGIMPGDCMIGERLQGGLVLPGGKELERADADVARRDAGQDAAGQQRLAKDHVARRHGRQRPRRRNAERRHRLGHDVFTQHRPERRAPVAAARERRRAGALQLQVEAPALAVDDLAQEHRPPVAELRHEIAELVARIGHGDRLGAVRDPLAGEHRDPLRRLQLVRIEAERLRQRLVERD